MIATAIVCCVAAAVWFLLRRVDWQSIEEENRRYYTREGYHLYYDRKILRRLRSEKREAQTPLKSEQ